MAIAAGIIAEYNPFHRGHQYHIEETKRRTNAKYIVVAMSGDFVQRGEPALFSKALRARMALLSGADLVLELPAPFATGSAEDFALGAVSLLEGLGCVSFLSFGSESEDLGALTEAARILAEEPPSFSSLLKEKLRLGFSYPQARMAALKCSSLSEKGLKAIQEPNGLLGTEYLKAMLRQKSAMEPIAVRRQGLGYHNLEIPDISPYRRPLALKDDENLHSTGKTNGPNQPSGSYGSNYSSSGYGYDCINGHGSGYGSGHSNGHSYASASALRKAVTESLPQIRQASPGPAFKASQSLLSQIPESLHPFYKAESISENKENGFNEGFFPLCPDDFSALLTCRILECMEKGGDFQEFSDISPELEGRLKGHGLSFLSFSERAKALKTRQYTYTRASRGLLHILLGIRREDMDAWRRSGCPYARILGFKRQSAPLLRLIKEQGTIPLIAKAADAPENLSGASLRLWERSLYASHVYAAILHQTYASSPSFPKGRENEYGRPLVIL